MNSFCQELLQVYAPAHVDTLLSKYMGREVPLYMCVVQKTMLQVTPALFWVVWAQELDDAARLEAERKAAEEKRLEAERKAALEAEIRSAELQMACEQAAERQAAPRLLQATSKAPSVPKSVPPPAKAAVVMPPPKAVVVMPPPKAVPSKKEPVALKEEPDASEEDSGALQEHSVRLTRLQKKLQRKR